jgi:hypothetical protein
VVDGGGLENHCTGNRAGGSNPSPSAIRLASDSAERQVGDSLMARLIQLFIEILLIGLQPA